MSPTVTTFLFEAANFLVLAAALGWLFFKPVRQAILDYREKFAADNQQAAAKLAEAEAMRQQIQDKHAQLQSELNERRNEELAAIQRRANEILTAARAEAAQQREQSLLLASRISDSQRDTLAEVAAASAADAVGKLLQQIEGPDLQAGLVQAACRQLESLQHQVLAPVKVESSESLSAQQTAALRAALGAAGETADFRIAEGIGAGVRVSTARGLIDTSTSGLSYFARQSLVKEMQQRASQYCQHPMQGANDV